MRKELGKWLLDIAKYIVTAIFLSSVFGELESWTLYIASVIVVLLTLSIGMVLLSGKGFGRRNNSDNNS